MNDIGGSGTEQNPFRISSLEELRAARQELDAHYELANDINASKSKREEFEPIGDERNPFTGTFDGNDYEIRNLCIKRPEENCVGLFSYIGEKGQVKNLGLISPNVKGKKVVGSLAGSNCGEINSSYLKEGHISGPFDVGGLVGWNDREVESSYAVKSNGSGEINLGGLIGWNDGEVESLYAVEPNVSGYGNVGGIVGWNWGAVESSFILSSADKTNILNDTDLVLSRENHRILYVVETKTLYLQINNKMYSARGVSPIEVRSLLEDTEVVEMTDRFKSFVVKAT